MGKDTALEQSSTVFSKNVINACGDLVPVVFVNTLVH
jgi:hypothetical protein